MYHGGGMNKLLAMSVNHNSKMLYCYIGVFILVVLWCEGYHLMGQSKNEILGQPKMAIHYPVGKNLSQSFALVHRAYLCQDNWTYNARHFEASYFSTLAIGHLSKISLGLKYRNLDIFENGGQNEVWITHQFTYASRKRVARFGHRARIEKRFKGSRTSFRLRYRFAVDFPFQGQKLDVGEFYGITSLEPLHSFENKRNPEYDFRLSTGLGKLVKKGVRAQFLLDYRWIDIFEKKDAQIFLLMDVHFHLRDML